MLAELAEVREKLLRAEEHKILLERKLLEEQMSRNRAERHVGFMDGRQQSLDDTAIGVLNRVRDIWHSAGVDPRSQVNFLNSVLGTVKFSAQSVEVLERIESMVVCADCLTKLYERVNELASTLEQKSAQIQQLRKAAVLSTVERMRVCSRYGARTVDQVRPAGIRASAQRCMNWLQLRGRDRSTTSMLFLIACIAPHTATRNAHLGPCSTFGRASRRCTGASCFVRETQGRPGGLPAYIPRAVFVPPAARAACPSSRTRGLSGQTAGSRRIAWRWTPVRLGTNDARRRGSAWAWTRRARVSGEKHTGWGERFVLAPTHAGRDPSRQRGHESGGPSA